jgi:hypothetical protein
LLGAVEGGSERWGEGEERGAERWGHRCGCFSPMGCMCMCMRLDRLLKMRWDGSSTQL